ncbi:MAG: ArsR family transcriptional regulator [Chloroflexia bacterium]
MSLVDWKQGFFTTPRGRILLLLRRARRTVRELAEALDLAENAVRVQLATMQRNGLVEQGVRRTPGAGKPAYEYRLTPQAQSMFPNAHGIMLDSLLSDIEDRLSSDGYEEQLRAVGRRMARYYLIPPDGLRTQLEEAISLLDKMGGVMELEEKDGKYVICGYNCPLATIPQKHPQVCKLLEAMLTSMLGVPIREQCNRGELLSCRFEVPVP